MPIGINLQLHAAITENPFGHHRDHIDARDFRRNNKWRGLVIRIRCTRANRGHKRLLAAPERAVPLAGLFKKGNKCVAARYCALQHHMGIEPHQLAIGIRITVARTRSSRLDVTQHRTGVAANRVISHAHPPFVPPESRPAPGQEWLGFSARGSRSRHAARSKSREPSESPPARQCPSLQTGQSAKDPRSKSIPPEEYRRPRESSNRAGS